MISGNPAFIGAPVSWSSRGAKCLANRAKWECGKRPILANGAVVPGGVCWTDLQGTCTLNGWAKWRAGGTSSPFKPARGTDKMASPFKRVCACFELGLCTRIGAAQPCPAHATVQTRGLPVLFLGCVAVSLCAPIARADSFVQLDYNIFLASRARATVFVQLFNDRPLTVANFLQYV